MIVKQLGTQRRRDSSWLSKYLLYLLLSGYTSIYNRVTCCVF
ncbi:hypothetical protein OIU84_014540 [Salix udensis]|uniref:Uncharacterized protein n=1 Tax=Salix udensis TaxID=889485 RepID=A0AAD6NRM7_9ROSI|nr:hypothetical protein OIU84_014540 [Salix udensis]